MEKKTASKLDETKVIVKATEVKAPKKAEETVATVKKNEEKKSTSKTAIASKVQDAAAEAKKAVAAETKKAVEETKELVEKAKETVKEKKSTRASAKASVKEEVKPEIFIQFEGNEAVLAELVQKAKDQFIADGHRVSTIKSMQMYLKPEELAAYYVINQKFAGKVDMF